MSILHHEDQPDLSNAPPDADRQDLILYRDMSDAAATVIVDMLDGVRAKDRTWDGASVRTAIAHHRNMLEASLAALDTVEAECRYHLAGREPVVFPMLPPARKSFGRRTQDSSLPATVSPGALS